AWASGALTVEDVVAALEQRRLFESEEPAKVRLREGLVELLVRYGSERWLPQPTVSTATTASTAPPKLLSGRVRLAVADYLSQKNDERAVAVYEDLLRETERTKGQGPPVRVVGAVNHLASHYVRHGQLQKAVELYQGAEKYSDSPYWHATIRLDAARLYGQMGEEKKANELYAQVPQYGAGWLTGLMRLDKARELMRQGQHQEARTLLLQPVTGAGAEQVQVALSAFLGYSSYQSGDLNAARRYCQEALERFNSLPKDQFAKDLEAPLNLARRTLQQVEQWTQEPIQVEPRELQIEIEAGATRPLLRRLTVRTFQPVPLNVVTDTPGIKARVLPGDEWGNERPTRLVAPPAQEVIVEVSPAALQNAASATLIISSPQLVGHQVKVPLQVK
ncbi:MAG: hypothetical protein M3347_16495, partial [Armatimonadota bacterium]|nr:hypothetical protein [Armatimonadota bacterium]